MKDKGTKDHAEDRKDAKPAGESLAAMIGSGLRSAAGFAVFTGACAGAGVLAGAAGHFYKYALTPKKHDTRLDADPREKEYVEGRKWFRGHPLREDIYIRADDGLQLHGSFIPGEPADGHRYAICVHGYADTSESMGLYARVYRDRYGMHVLLPDLRGHGRSDGDYVGMGYDDSFDLLRWIDWILERDREAQIVLHGISMGAATVLMTTGTPLPAQVLAAVADSSYTSAMDLFAFLYEREPGSRIPAPVMLETLRAIALVRAGYDLAKASPLKAVAYSKTPTLFIHGQGDGFVPPEMMPQLFRAAACRKAFLWIPEAGHVQAVNVDPETYWGRVEKFFHTNGVGLF